MATHPSILAQRIPMDRGTWWAMVHGVEKSRTRSPWTEEPGGLRSMGSKRVGHDPHGQRNLVGYSPWGHTESDMIPMDRGTWWATVHGVAKSRTRSPRTEEPGGLQYMGSHRVGHD